MSKASPAHGVLKVLKVPVSRECRNSFPDPDALHDRYKERAAIMEYDAGMSRAEAEAAAWADVFGNRPSPLQQSGWPG